MKINLNPPAVVFFVNNLRPDLGGEARGPLVRILTKYEKDEGILQHELEHVRQFWTMVFFACLMPTFVLWVAGVPFSSPLFYLPLVGLSAHSLLYLLSPAYRLWAELRAYAVQVKFAPDKEAAIPLFGRFISESYRLKISAVEAVSRLRSLC